VLFDLDGQLHWILPFSASLLATVTGWSGCLSQTSENKKSRRGLAPRRRRTTSAYSSTGLPARPGCPSSSLPTRSPCLRMRSPIDLL
jgi:hypothetical protein